MPQYSWPVGFALLAAVLFAAGCDKAGKANDNRDKSKVAHAHPSKGPHGGALIEWGDEEYHLEFTVDHKNQEAIVYILDDTAKKAKPIKASELTLTIKQSPPAPRRVSPASMKCSETSKSSKARSRPKSRANPMSATSRKKPTSIDCLNGRLQSRRSADRF